VSAASAAANRAASRSADCGWLDSQHLASRLKLANRGREVTTVGADIDHQAIEREFRRQTVQAIAEPPDDSPSPNLPASSRARGSRPKASTSRIAVIAGGVSARSSHRAPRIPHCNKAARDELRIGLPVWLDREDDGRVTRSADEQVRHAIERVFAPCQRSGLRPKRARLDCSPSSQRQSRAHSITQPAALGDREPLAFNASEPVTEAGALTGILRCDCRIRPTERP
jgi:hypothetical protein